MDEGVEQIVEAWARERPDLDVEAMAAVTRLWQLAKVCGDQRRRVITAAGADQATLDLLSVLRRAGEPYELTPGEIARRAMVTAGAISQRLARAESDELVERTRAKEGRGRVVRLLPAGHLLVDQLVGRIAAADADLLRSLNAEKRRMLDELLTDVLDDVEHRIGAPPVSQVGATEAGAADRSPHRRSSS